MGWSFSRSILLGLAFSAVVAKALPEIHPDDFDFVLDIDNVLVFADERARQLSPDVQEVLLRMGVLAKANKKIYRVAHGAGTFIQALTHIHGSRISFFSAHAQAGRTAEIVGQIRLPNGKTAGKVAHNILFRPSTVQLHLLPPEHRERYRAAWSIFNPPPGAPQEKKDLMKVTWVPNLARTFLIDDAIANAMPGQEKNLVWSRPGHGVYELARLRGLIDRALDRAKRKSLRPIDAMFDLQWLAGSREPGQNLLFDKEGAVDEVLMRGYEKMLKEDPLFDFDDEYLLVIDSGKLSDALALEKKWLERQERGPVIHDLPEILRREKIEVPANAEREISAVNHGPRANIPAFAEVPAPAAVQAPPLPQVFIPQLPQSVTVAAGQPSPPPAISVPVTSGALQPAIGPFYVGANSVVVSGPWGITVPESPAAAPAKKAKPPGRLKACWNHLWEAGRALIKGDIPVDITDT